MNIPKNWTEEKTLLLKNSYPELPKLDVLKLFPDYQWKSLQNIATELKIKRNFCEQRRGNIENLFNESNESYYWLGLIAADGCISEDGTLKVDLMKNDTQYLMNLAKFLNTKILFYPSYFNSYGKGMGNGICRVKIKDFRNGVKLRDLFKINGLKTYNPFSIDFINTKEHLTAFLGGLIDGDGTIGAGGNIAIDMHENYKDFMYEFGDKLVKFEIISHFKVNFYEKMVRIAISSSNTFDIRKGLIDMKLPIMKRKWDRAPKIKTNQNLIRTKTDLIIKMRSEGKTLKEICDVINYKSQGSLHNFLKRNNLL